MIKALPGAQKTDGFQANRNMLMGRDARADSIPGLEIQADDVRCTHASATGQIEEEMIFYLMSRGLPRAEAVKLAVDGFFVPVLDRIVITSYSIHYTKLYETCWRDCTPSDT